MTFSVIVPVYNATRYLRTALESIHCQTYSDWECICVDDGSTDNSLSILREYERKDPRFIVVSQQNMGVSAARNKGLDFAKGEWVVFLDADDGYYLNALESIIKIAGDANADIIHYGYRLLKEVSAATTISTLRYSSYSLDKRGDALLAFNATRMLVAWNACFRRDLIQTIRFKSLSIGEDMIFGLEAFVTAKSIAITDDVYYQYRHVETSAINTVSLNHVESSFEGLVLWMRILRSWRYCKLARKFIKKRLLLYASNGLRMARKLEGEERRIAIAKYFQVGTQVSRGFKIFEWAFACKSEILIRLFFSSVVFAKITLSRLRRLV